MEGARRQGKASIRRKDAEAGWPALEGKNQESGAWWPAKGGKRQKAWQATSQLVYLPG